MSKILRFKNNTPINLFYRMPRLIHFQGFQMYQGKTDGFSNPLDTIDSIEWSLDRNLTNSVPLNTFLTQHNQGLQFYTEINSEDNVIIINCKNCDQLKS